MQLFGKKEIQMPHVFSIIIVLIVLCGCLTYIIPSGIYDRIESGGITKIDVDSFHFIDQTPVSPFEWFVAIPEGFAAGASVIAVIFICVAGMSIYTSTGAFTNCINFFIKKSGKKGTGLLIFALMLYFFLNGGLTGAVDGPVALAPIIIGFALAAGYDALTGLSIVCVCAICGFSCGPTNPYTVVVAQEIAELPPFSGAALRTVCWLAIMAVTFQHIYAYASKVRKDPSKSLAPGITAADIGIVDNGKEELSRKDKIMVVMLLLTIIIAVVCCLVFQFSLPQVSAIYIISGIIGGIVYGYNNNQIATIFVDSAKNVFVGAMCIGLARAIQIILTNGNIIDTIVYYASNALNILPPSIAAVGMFVFQTIINFFINSGSGQAAVTMPIMVPLADTLNITRQTAVLAFQLGDGLSNLVFPTSGSLFAYLACSKVDYGTFLKFAIPLFLKISTVGIIFVLVASFTNYGPF